LIVIPLSARKREEGIGKEKKKNPFWPDLEGSEGCFWDKRGERRGGADF